MPRTTGHIKPCLSLQPRALTPALHAFLESPIARRHSFPGESFDRLLKPPTFTTIDEFLQWLCKGLQELAGALADLYQEHWPLNMDRWCAEGTSLDHTAIHKPKLLSTQNTESHPMFYRESSRPTALILVQFLVQANG